MVGQWDNPSCNPHTINAGWTHYFTFVLDETSYVSITLEAEREYSYLQLSKEGSGERIRIIAGKDRANTGKYEISRTLTSGGYRITAGTDVKNEEDGWYTFTITGIPPAARPTATPSLTPTPSPWRDRHVTWLKEPRVDATGRLTFQARIDSGHEINMPRGSAFYASVVITKGETYHGQILPPEGETWSWGATSEDQSVADTYLWENRLFTVAAPVSISIKKEEGLDLCIWTGGEREEDDYLLGCAELKGVRAAPPPTAAPTPTRQATPRPTPTSMPRPSTPTPSPTPAPTATATPKPLPTATARLDQVDTPSKRAETVTTSLGSRVNITVSGFADSPARFDDLTWAINEIETLIGIPYPAPVLTMLLGTPSGGFCGHNQMEYEARYSREPYTVESSNIKVEVTERCHQTLSTIVHEAAHTWFHGSMKANWIDEGLANAVENQVIAQATGTDYLPVTHCASYRNIRELEQANPLRASIGVSRAGYQGFKCNYSLGDGIFGDLRWHYGDQEFNRRLARLARNRVSATDGDLTVNDIRDAFGDGGLASAIIEEWYGGNPEVRLHRHLDAVEWIQPPTTDGEWLRLHGVLREGQIHDLSPGDTNRCSQFALFSGIGNLTWVKSVEDPIPIGWTRHQTTRVFAANYRTDPRTGEFEITARVLDRALDRHEHLSLLVRDRVGTGTDGLCLESAAYSHVPVQRGDIPDRFKNVQHHHEDAIEWREEPRLNGTTLTFAGRASPGAINLWYKENTCSQIGIYSYDDQGYSFVAWVNPQLRDNRRWVNAESEITKGHTYQDGNFEVTATVRRGVMPQSTAALLVITEENPSTGQKCGNPPVLSVREILR
ncbi:MAG: M1 family metallopeptidase [Chloroflexi bacterium]|nr:M1 family metallopeptidase [Chloroflexota bacterium]